MQTFQIDNEVVLIDAEDWLNISKHKWHLNKGKSNCVYAIGRPYGGQQKVLLHRYIYFINNIPIPDNYVIDHINHIGLDNRKSNLHIVTHQENILNRKSAQSNSVLKIPGVTLHKAPSKYRAYVCIERKYKHIGLYDSIKEAIDARESYKLKHNLKMI